LDIGNGAYIMIYKLFLTNSGKALNGHVENAAGMLQN
jgi:hypothetical protein